MYQEIESKYIMEEEMANEILSNVIQEEIQGVLATIQDDKAPGNDGYLSYFITLHGK